MDPLTELSIRLTAPNGCHHDVVAPRDWHGARIRHISDIAGEGTVISAARGEAVRQAPPAAVQASDQWHLSPRSLR